MELSELSIRILLLFFPGLICSYIVDAFTIHKPRDYFFFTLRAFVYGLSSYFGYWIILKFRKIYSPSIDTSVIFLNALRDPNVIISYAEVAYVTFIALIFGIIITLSSTYKIHFRIVHKLKITKKFGELDVWGFTFNSPQINWATVRDHKNNLVYDGWVQAFSDDSKDAEIFLRDVSIYKNDSGEKLYQGRHKGSTPHIHEMSA